MNAKTNLPHVEILTSPDWQEYALLDSGDGKKLEQFGKVRLIRPEAEAVWSRKLSENEWNRAAAEFIPTAEENGGHWKKKSTVPADWKIRYKDLLFQLMLSNSKQVGIFPEQACQWDWVRKQIALTEGSAQVLNLFGYTGGMSVAAAAAGAKVTHLDASKKAVQWAKENQTASNLGADSIRWILDDGLKFVQREARRGNRYHGIILDPPKFGRGPKGEVWEFYRGFPELIQACGQILAPGARFLLVTAYAIKASSLTLNNALSELRTVHGGLVTSGEVCLQDRSGRLLSMAIYGRWQKSPDQPEK